MINARKDGQGNIIITEESFKQLLDSADIKDECLKILNEKYVFDTIEKGYYLTKRYEFRRDVTPWSGDDVGKVYDLFKNTRIEYVEPKNLKPVTNECIKGGTKPLGVDEHGWIVCKPEPRPWLIERYDGWYLTISEDGKKNRPWKKSEIEMIRKKFNDIPREVKLKRILDL